ncbi:MAG: hypothetical protein K0Q52_177 [Microbacterium sp.]|jgi:hypothetical protein|nr:hypothetical protein [Microbacterium sp.]
MSTATAPEPVSTLNRSHRIVQSRYATGNPARALDVMVRYDKGARQYVSWVRAVTLYPGGGEGYTLPRQAELAGFQSFQSAKVGRYSEAQHLKSAGTILLAYAPTLARMIEWAEGRA